MDNSSIKRRASEPEASEALALISTQQSSRIPPPLPYLPSDYRPSADSPRHFVVSPIYTHQNNSGNATGKRQRSRSIGYPLAIENNTAVASTSSNVVANHNREHFELVPYREWTVIARNNQKGQVVLYNQDSHSVTVQNYLPDHYNTIDPNVPIQLKAGEGDNCPYCHRPMISTAASSESKNNEPDFMDRNYFRLLASSQANTASNSPVQSRSSTFSSDTGKQQPLNSQNLNANAFNQGYYSKFFIEVNKLGKGFRGSVFLCEHMLDGVKLGKYAIKKVAIGNNHPWLVRMLREVHLLERLRHPNIVSYKHSWLEYNRLTPFGPEVPCLFILMECANGGNLEEYFEPKSQPTQPTQQPKQERRRSTKELKRERIRRQYQAQESFEKDQDISSPITDIRRRLLTMTEIWSLFLDIVQGLAHLHQQNIVHRDLKPPNLLLQYDDRNRHGQQGIPRVLISDFGECEDLDETTIDSNRTGATGTLEFMAPEHVRLDPRGRNTVDYSPKADMWSLGMVLYFLCYSRLPYSVVDDVDLLRTEILSFKDIRFPASRFDIYKTNPTLFNEANNNSDLTSDIPNELKLLIRVLLSIDPTKRPSCNEILSKLRSFRRDNHASIFQDIQPNPTPSPPVSSPSPPPPTSTKDSAENPTVTTLASSSPELMTKENFGDESFVEPTFKKHRLGSLSNEDESTSSLNSHDEGNNTNQVLRKRQRLLSNDTIMADDPASTIDEVPVSPPRLLLGSPDLIESNNGLRWLITERRSIQAIKTGTAVLKIASCTYSCSPYSAKPSILYPVIFFATLDFWNESSSPSFILLLIHIFWIMSTTLWTGGLCTA